MREVACRFFSDGLRVRGKFLVALTRHGITCFGFDDRRFGESEGTPGRVTLEEQVRDAQHAVARAATRLVIDAGRHLPGVRGLIERPREPRVVGDAPAIRQRSRRGVSGTREHREPPGTSRPA